MKFLNSKIRKAFILVMIVAASSVGWAQVTPPSSEADCTLLFPGTSWCGVWEWTQGPAATAGGMFARTPESKATLTLFDMNNGPTDGITLPTVVLSMNMPGHGHKDPPSTVVQARDANNQPIPGTYNVTKMYFSMKGPWIITVTVGAAKSELRVNLN